LFTEDQLEVVDYLRKNIYATKLFYDILNKSQIFGKLSSRVKPWKSLEAIAEITKSEIEETHLKSQRRMTNPQQYEEIEKLDQKKLQEADSKEEDDEEGDLLAENEYDENKINLYFDYLFTKKNHGIEYLF
jgi:hypothetical protein